MKESYSSSKIKIHQLILELQKGLPLSVSEMCSILNCSRRSIYNYIKALTNSGVKIQYKLNKGTAYYWIDNKSSNYHESLLYDKLSFEHLRQFTILERIQDCPMSRANLINQFHVNSSPPYDREQTAIDIRKSKFYAMLNDLLKHGELIEIDDHLTHDKKLVLSSNSIKKQLCLSEKEILQMHFELSLSLNGAPYSPQLVSVYEKVCAVLGIIEKENPYYQNYLQFGKERTGYKNSYAKLKLICSLDYKSHYLQIQYLTRNNTSREITFGIGLILYCAEKDIYYILGKEYDDALNNSYLNSIIDVTSIISVIESKYSNHIFQSDEYLRIAAEMFSISMEDPTTVIVEFQRTANVERKVYNLHKHRKHSHLLESENFFRYTDTIRGLNDFANYLRMFGQSATVIEPPELKELLNQSVTKSLQRYEVLEYERIH